MRILIVEDDSGISSALQQLLKKQSITSDICANLKMAEFMLHTEKFDLLLLDLSLPDGDGSHLLKNMRSNKNQLNAQTPVLIMTARDCLISMVSNLDLGADDYLVKPFASEVLIARIKAIIRRSKGFASSVFSYQNITLNLSTRKVQQNGKPVELSAKEFSLLQKFITNCDCVFSRSQLEQDLYNFETLIESNAVEVHIHNLRKKLGKNIIKTVRGIGYFMPAV